MERGDGDQAADDGIVAEDVTQLVEHIELTGAHRLPDSPDWELTTPAADLDDAPILIGSLPDPESTPTAVIDADYFTETQADLNRLVRSEEYWAEQAEAQAAERARWQDRVDELRRALAERDREIAERDRLIGELRAKLAALEAGAEPAAPAAAAPVPAPVEDAEATRELPLADIPETPAPALAAAVAPRLRRYLIGLDLVGTVHELTGRRITIGRTRDNDLRIVDPTVSRLHALLTVRDGVAQVIDANSRNGIFVNGIQVRYARLEDGDLVTFGTVRFRYRVGSGAEGAPAGSA